MNLFPPSSLFVFIDIIIIQAFFLLPIRNLIQSTILQPVQKSALLHYSRQSIPQSRRPSKPSVVVYSVNQLSHCTGIEKVNHIFQTISLPFHHANQTGRNGKSEGEKWTKRK